MSTRLPVLQTGQPHSIWVLLLMGLGWSVPSRMAKLAWEQVHERGSADDTLCVVQTYGADLTEAFNWCNKYQETRRDADLHQAWDLYYHIFRRINKNLPTVLSLDLKNVSDLLYTARDLELAVPGTYAAGEPVVVIHRFSQTLQVGLCTEPFCPQTRGNRT